MVMKHHTPTVLMVNGRNLYASDNCYDTIFIVNILQAYNQLSPLSHNTSELFSVTYISIRNITTVCAMQHFI